VVDIRTGCYLLNFREHFDGLMEWVDGLDPSKALATSRLAFLLPASGVSGTGRRFQRTGKELEADDAPSQLFADARAASTSGAGEPAAL